MVAWTDNFEARVYLNMSGAEIRRTYVNTRMSGAFGGLDSFIKNRRKWSDKKQVENELIKLESFAIHRPVRKHFKRKRVVVHFINELWSGDLASLSKYAKDNNGTNFLLVVIDALSKKMYVRPLKTKSSPDVIKAFSSIVKETKANGFNPPILYWSDQGTEFRSKAFLDYLKSQKIKGYYTFSAIKVSNLLLTVYVHTASSRLS